MISKVCRLQDSFSLHLHKQYKISRLMKFTTQLVLSAYGWYCVEHLGNSIFFALYVIAMVGQREASEHASKNERFFELVKCHVGAFHCIGPFEMETSPRREGTSTHVFFTTLHYVYHYVDYSTRRWVLYLT